MILRRCACCVNLRYDVSFCRILLVSLEQDPGKRVPTLLSVDFESRGISTVPGRRRCREADRFCYEYILYASPA